MPGGSAGDSCRVDARTRGTADSDQVSADGGVAVWLLSRRCSDYGRRPLAAIPIPVSLPSLCGDAHVENLGAYASLDNRIVFDLNDFDETIRGPFEWDVKRLATSVILAGRAGWHRPCGPRGRGRARSCVAIAARCAGSPTCRCWSWRASRFTASRTSVRCRRSSRRPSGLRRCGCWKSSPSPSIATARKLPQRKLPPRRLQQRRRLLLPRRRLRMRQGRRRNTLAAGRAASARCLRCWSALPARRRKVLAALDQYAKTLQPERQHFLAQYTPVDVAFKVVGTGSVGLRDYIVYLRGPRASGAL